MRRCSPMSQVLGLRLEVPGAASSAIASSSRLRTECRGTLQLRRTVVCQARGGRSWPDPNHKPSEAETQGIWGDAASNAAAAAAAAQPAAAAAPAPVQDKKPSPWDAATGGAGTPWSATATTTNQTPSWSSAASTQNKDVLSGSRRASPVAPATWKESPSSAGGEWLGKQIAAAEARKKQEAENAATGEGTGTPGGAAPAKKVVRMWYDEGYERDEAGNIILTDEQRTNIIEELRRKYAPKFAASGPLPQPQPQPQPQSSSGPAAPSPYPAPTRPPSTQVVGGGYADMNRSPPPKPAPTRPPSVQVVGGGYADMNRTSPPRSAPTRPPSIQRIPGGYTDVKPGPAVGTSGPPGSSSPMGASGPPVGASGDSAATAAQGPVVGKDGRPLNELEQLDLKYADRWKNWQPRGGAPPPPPQPPREPFKSVLDKPMYDKDGRQLNELEVLDQTYADRWKNWKPRHGQGDHPDDAPRSQDTGNFVAKRQGWQASAPPPPRSTFNWNAPPARSTYPSSPARSPVSPAPNPIATPSSPARNQPATRSGPAGNQSDESPGAWIRRELYASEENGVVGTGGPWFGGEIFNNQPPAAAGTGPRSATATGTSGSFSGGQAAQAESSTAATKPSFPSEAQNFSAGTGGPRFGNQPSFASQAGQGTRFGSNSVPAAGSPAATSPPASYGNPATRSPAGTSPSFSYGNYPAPASGSPATTSSPPSYGNSPAQGGPSFRSAPGPRDSSQGTYGGYQSTYGGSAPSYGGSPPYQSSYGGSAPSYGGSAPSYGGSAPQQKPFNSYWSKSTGTQASKPQPPPGPAWKEAFEDGSGATEGVMRPGQAPAPTPAPEPDRESLGNIQEAS